MLKSDTGVRMTDMRPQQAAEVLAVALPVLAVGNSIAFVSVLQSRWWFLPEARRVGTGVIAVDSDSTSIKLEAAPLDP